MTDWEVCIRTESNYIKKIRVNDCVTRSDAEAAALGMSGAKEVCYSTPKSYDNDDNYSSQIIENHYYDPQTDYDEEDDEEDFHKSLDKLEIEMYDLLCQIHMNEGKELPTIEDFYSFLNS